MKICHCVKMTKEENDALHTVLEILDEMRNDDMISQNCEDGYGVHPSNVHYDLENIIAYLKSLQ